MLNLFLAIEVLIVGYNWNNIHTRLTFVIQIHCTLSLSIFRIWVVVGCVCSSIWWTQNIVPFDFSSLWVQLFRQSLNERLVLIKEIVCTSICNNIALLSSVVVLPSWFSCCCFVVAINGNSISNFCLRLFFLEKSSLSSDCWRSCWCNCCWRNCWWRCWWRDSWWNCWRHCRRDRCWCIDTGFRWSRWCSFGWYCWCYLCIGSWFSRLRISSWLFCWVSLSSSSWRRSHFFNCCSLLRIISYFNNAIINKLELSIVNVYTVLGGIFLWKRLLDFSITLSTCQLFELSLRRRWILIYLHLNNDIFVKNLLIEVTAIETNCFCKVLLCIVHLCLNVPWSLRLHLQEFSIVIGHTIIVFQNAFSNLTCLFIWVNKVVPPTLLIQIIELLGLALFSLSIKIITKDSWILMSCNRLNR